MIGSWSGTFSKFTMWNSIDHNYQINYHINSLRVLRLIYYYIVMLNSLRVLIWCLFWYYVLIVNFQNFPVHVFQYIISKNSTTPERTATAPEVARGYLGLPGFFRSENYSFFLMPRRFISFLFFRHIFRFFLI